MGNLILFNNSTTSFLKCEPWFDTISCETLHPQIMLFSMKLLLIEASSLDIVVGPVVQVILIENELRCKPSNGPFVLFVCSF